MRSFDRCVLIDLTRIGCSDIFEGIVGSVVYPGRGSRRGRGGGSVRVGSGVRGGDDGGGRSELLHRAIFGIGPMAGRWFACKEAVETFRRARTPEDAMFASAIKAGVIRGLVIE